MIWFLEATGTYLFARDTMATCIGGAHQSKFTTVHVSAQHHVAEGAVSPR
jgi:hypothetical protein